MLSLAARVESKFQQVDNDVYTITIPLAAGSGASIVLVEGVYFAESKRFQDGAARVSFAIDDLIEKGAINAMSFRESHLISLLLNRDSQQLKNFAVIKYTCVTA